MDGFGGMGGMGGFTDMDDILGSIFGGFGFGGGSKRTNVNAPRRGNDIQTDVTLSFMDACRGKKKPAAEAAQKRAHPLRFALTVRDEVLSRPHRELHSVLYPHQRPVHAVAARER